MCICMNEHTCLFFIRNRWVTTYKVYNKILTPELHPFLQCWHHQNQEKMNNTLNFKPTTNYFDINKTNWYSMCVQFRIMAPQKKLQIDSLSGHSPQCDSMCVYDINWYPGQSPKKYPQKYPWVLGLLKPPETCGWLRNPKITKRMVFQPYKS
jgi:hypothetical protein